MLELLPVGEVAGPSPIRQGEHDTGCLVMVTADTGGRLDVLGGGLRLADHDHHPESRHVDADGDHVGGEHQIDALVLKPEPGLALVGLLDPEPMGLEQLVEDVPEIGSADTGCELDDLGLPPHPLASAVRKIELGGKARREEAAAIAFYAAEAVLEFVGRDAVHAGELADGGEVANRRHPRVGRVDPGGRHRGFGFVPLVLRCRHHGSEEPRLGFLQAASGGADTDIQPTGGLVERQLPSEEGVVDVENRRREDARLPREHRSRLLGSASDRGRRRDDLGVHRSLANRPRCKLVDRRLVEPGERAERPGDEVEFVLDDEVGWTEPRAIAQYLGGRDGLDGDVAGWRVADVRPVGAVGAAPAVLGTTVGHPAEEHADVGVPGQLGELVDRADDERR